MPHLWFYVHLSPLLISIGFLPRHARNRPILHPDYFPIQVINSLKFWVRNRKHARSEPNLTTRVIAILYCFVVLSSIWPTLWFSANKIEQGMSLGINYLPWSCMACEHSCSLKICQEITVFLIMWKFWLSLLSCWKHRYRIFVFYWKIHWIDPRNTKGKLQLLPCQNLFVIGAHKIILWICCLPLMLECYIKMWMFMQKLDVFTFTYATRLHCSYLWDEKLYKQEKWKYELSNFFRKGLLFTRWILSNVCKSRLVIEPVKILVLIVIIISIYSFFPSLFFPLISW